MSSFSNTDTPVRKLKFNDKFKPASCHEGDELYPNGIFEFNITKLLKFVNENPDDFPVEMVDVESIKSFPPTNPDESTIQSADFSKPIILAEISPGRFNVIDGNHRLEKARRDNKDKILAYRLHPEQHVQFLSSKESYEEYIKYWNAKVCGQ